MLPGQAVECEPNPPATPPHGLTMWRMLTMRRMAAMRYRGSCESGAARQRRTPHRLVLEQAREEG